MEIGRMTMEKSEILGAWRDPCGVAPAGSPNGSTFQYASPFIFSVHLTMHLVFVYFVIPSPRVSDTVQVNRGGYWHR
jgi:hypothetical protein